MSKNILADLNSLSVEMLDGDGHSLHEGSTVAVFEKLIGYVRNCTWSDNDTVRFICRNFNISQSDMPGLWSMMYPDKAEKADSTFRVQYHNINKYLGNIFPNNLYDIFIGDKQDELSSLSSLIDALYFNDKRIEPELGAQLCYTLSQLDLTGKKYGVDECKTELEIIRLLSMQRNTALLEKCDKSKLAYVYWVLTRPSVTKGVLNQTRLSFIKAMTDMNEDPKPTLDLGTVSVSGEAILFGVAKKVYDLLVSESGVTESMSLINSVLADLDSLSDTAVYRILTRVRDLVLSGNELTGVRTLLSNVFTQGLVVDNKDTDRLEINNSGDVSNLVSRVNSVCEEKGINSVLIGGTLESDEDVEKLLATVKSICAKKGLKYPDTEDYSAVFANGGMQTIKNYVKDTTVTEDTILNTDVINFIHLHCTKNGIERGLKQFPKEDIAYVVKGILEGNKDYLESIKYGINLDSRNFIGENEMCWDAKHEIERLVIDIEPSILVSDFARGIVKDYTINGMKSRLGSVDVSELAKLYDDMLSTKI